MKIRTLNLIAFGKFHHKVIELDDGFNLVFGRNEAGKTTIQHFVEGMFFGFYKPYRKKRAYNDNYYRYKPWNGNQYCGSLIYEDDLGRLIRIERDFLALRDGVRIYDNLTGEDISAEYPYDSVNKQYMPLDSSHYSAVLYNNTVNVKQMESVPGPELAREVNDRLLNMVSNASDSLSIDRVLAYVDRRKQQIGSIGKSASPYGRVSREIREQEALIKNSEQNRSQIEINQKEITHYQNLLNEVRQKIRDLEKECDLSRATDLKAVEAKMSGLNAEINHLENTINEEEKSLADIDPELYGHLKIMDSSVRAYNERLERLETKLERFTKEKEEIEHNFAEVQEEFGDYSMEEIEEDYNAVKNLPSGFSNPGSFSAEQKFQQNASDSVPEKKDSNVNSLNPKILMAGIVLGVFILLFGIFNPGNLLSGFSHIAVMLIGGLMGGICAVMFFLTRDRFRDPLSVMPNSDITQASDPLVACLAKYGCHDRTELNIFVEESRALYDQMIHLEESKKRLSNSIENLKEEYNALMTERDDDQTLIDESLSFAGVDSIEAYGDLCSGKNASTVRQSHLEELNQLYETLSEQKEVLSDTTWTYYGSSGEEMTHLLEHEKAYQYEIDHLMRENQALMYRESDIVSIEERIETLKVESENYAIDLAACEMVEDFFKNYAKKIHSASVPDLNEKIGKMIYGVTGKYNEVHVDDQMNIRVVDPESGNLLSLNQLSGGTIDQLSLALRFGVADLIDDQQTMPLLLDDPFVQYDDDRKAAALSYLTSLVPKKQIVMFTCSADEKQILERKGFAYAGIGI